jgi:hypothetical protein
MADEPILCFDGDKAGQKAAWRAADLALPHLKPGKSLRFALLPEGQDPDDLARSGGRAAIEEVIGAARGLADMIWSREIEGGTFATPERRAALEARIGELSNGIRDEVVRRYYRQDLAERLQRTFAPEGGRGGYARGNFGKRPGGESGGRFGSRAPFTSGAAGRFGGGGRRGQANAGQVSNRGPYQAASAQLAASPIMRGQRSALSRREALILQSLINQPIRRPTSSAPPLSRPSPATITIRPSPKNRPKKCGPISRREDFRRYFKGLWLRSRPRRCGACSPGQQGKMFFRPGSSSLPCIRKLTPYLGKRRMPSWPWARSPARPIWHG